MDADGIERRLQEWAHWLTLGQARNGFSVINVLHPSWSPPSPGQTPTLKAGGPSDAQERATHRAICQLPIKLQATLQAHYVVRGTVADQAQRLGCAEVTVHERVRRAKVYLAQHLNVRANLDPTAAPKHE